MLENVDELKKIIAEKGLPDFISQGENANFAFLEWEDDYNIVCCESALMYFSKDYIIKRINGSPLHIQLFILEHSCRI